MKLKICFLTVLAIGVAQAEQGRAQAEQGRAQAGQRRTPKKAAAKKELAPAAEIVIPPGAKLVEPGTYTFTDSQGKKWIYRKTPFGIARSEDKPAAVEAAPAEGPTTTATEDGDTIRFERPGPFGPYRWQKKKTELDKDEQSAWERSRGKQAEAAKAKE